MARYDIFTDDAQEALNILTPTLVERLLSMERLFNTKKFVCCIHDRQIHFAVEKKIDLFPQVSMRRNLIKEGTEMLREVRENFSSIHRVIEQVQIK